MKKIDLFEGKYFFLSNFYPCSVVHDGMLYDSSEAAFQAYKLENKTDRVQFTKMKPGKAKRLGKKVSLRSGWEEIKERVMYEVVSDKFYQNKNLRDMLLETGDAYLEEGNTWGDDEWGTVNGFGENKLGKILMRVREELRTYEG